MQKRGDLESKRKVKTTESTENTETCLKISVLSVYSVVRPEICH